MMSKYAEDIFREPAVLRKKLDMYLKTPQKTMLYARAAEKFFYSSGKRYVKFKLLEAGVGGDFLEVFSFFFIEKNYIETLVIFICSIFLSWILLLIWVVCGVFAKYSVCMNFLKCLEMQDDEMLSIQGGTNDWVIYIAIIFIVAALSIGIFAAL